MVGRRGIECATWIFGLHDNILRNSALGPPPWPRPVLPCGHLFSLATAIPNVAVLMALRLPGICILAIAASNRAAGVSVGHPWTKPGYSGPTPFRDGAYSGEYLLLTVTCGVPRGCYLCRPFLRGTPGIAGPFTQLTSSFLNVVDLDDGFGPEDKLVMCNGDLVFIDLDINGDWFSFKGGAWSTGAITLQNQCPSGAQLFPRSNGYAVRRVGGASFLPSQPLLHSQIGVTTITSAPGRPPADRLLLVGGSDVSAQPWYKTDTSACIAIHLSPAPQAASRNNVYYSDNCGRSWACSSLPQIWSAQQYASILHAPPAGGFAPNQVRATNSSCANHLLPPPLLPPPPPSDLHGWRHRVKWRHVRRILYVHRRRPHVVAPQVHQPDELRTGVLQRALLVAVHAPQRRHRRLRQLQQLVGVAPVPRPSRLSCLPRL